MYVKNLELNQFRNYKKEAIEFVSGINLLYGKNAQGKTNILEALYLSATGRSHRTNTYHDLIKNGTNGFEIKVKANTREREHLIIISYSKDKGRLTELNGIRRDKLSDILGTFNMILFSPETLSIVKGTPQERRKFIDVLLCQTSRHYLYCLQQYNHLIKNKAAALKKSRIEKQYDSVIPIWNEHISKYGGCISSMRYHTIKQLNLDMKNEMMKISDHHEESELIYKTYGQYEEHDSEEIYVKELFHKLESGMQKEKDMCQCLYGPHRDDMEILLNGMNSRQYCSQGQQRSLALSLVMAQLKYIENAIGEKPVLLLDDVLSELDSKRQEYLLTGLEDVQTIITTTDDKKFEQLESKSIKRFCIHEGQVL